MPEFWKRVLWSVLLLPITGGGAYFVRKVLAAWGILDPYAATVGRWLKVSPAILWDTVALIFFAIFYIAALLLIWRYGRTLSSAKLGTLDNTIEFSWEPAPNDLVVPADGKYYDLTLSPTPEELQRGGPATVITTPGSVVKLMGHVYKCAVINHGPVSIFNASMEIQSVFRAVDNDAQPSAIITSPGPVKIQGEGKKILSRPWHISIPKVDANPATPFIFFLSSPNEVWIHLSAPKTITFQRLGSTKVETAKLIAPFRSDLTIAPPMPWMIAPFQTEKQPADMAERDTKMAEALAYVKLRKWGQKFSLAVASTGDGTALNEVRQAALDKTVRIWGRRSPNDHAYLEIPFDYWRDWQIDLLGTLKGESATDKLASKAEGFKYYDLMASKAEFERKWPPKN